MKTSIRSLEAQATRLKPVSPDSLAPHLCYACHTAITSRSSRGTSNSETSSVQLPLWAHSKIGEIMQEPSSLNSSNIDEGEIWIGRTLGQDDMKESISNFLLE